MDAIKVYERILIDFLLNDMILIKDMFILDDMIRNGISIKDWINFDIMSIYR